MRFHLGLGSNLGDRLSYLETAVAELACLGSDLATSGVYETVPVGGPSGQGPYLNCVVRLEADLSPRQLLGSTSLIETRAGRVRAVPNGPRTLDIDILLADELRISEPDLVVPHPRMLERAFVLAPLEELDPELVPERWRDALGGRRVVAAQVRRVGTLSSS